VELEEKEKCQEESLEKKKKKKKKKLPEHRSLHDAEN